MSEAFLKTKQNQIFEYCENSDEIPLIQLVKITEKLKYQLRNLPQVVLYKYREPESNENSETMLSKSTNSTSTNSGSADASLAAENAGQNFNTLSSESQSEVWYDDDSVLKEMVDNVWRDDGKEDTNSKRVASPETTRATNALERVLGNYLDGSVENIQPSSPRYEIYGDQNAFQRDKRKARSKSHLNIDECFDNWMAGEESRPPKRKKKKSNTPNTSAETNYDEREEFNVPNITIAPDNSSATIVNVDATPNGHKQGVIEINIPQHMTKSINMGSYKMKIDLSKITILENFTKPAANSEAKSKAVVKKPTTRKPKASPPKKRGRKPRKAITDSSTSAEKSEVARFVELFSRNCNEYMADTNMSPNGSSNVVSTTTGLPNGNNWEVIRPTTNAHRLTVSSTQVSSSQSASLSTTNASHNSWSDDLYTVALEDLENMPLVRHINDSDEAQIVDLLQANEVTNNVTESNLVPYSPNYLGQQAQQKSLPLPVQLNPPTINRTSSTMVPLAAPGIKMDAKSENDSGCYPLDLTKRKSSADDDLLWTFEKSIVNSNQSLPDQYGAGPSMPSLDDVDDVVNELIENELIENESNSIPSPKTHVNVDAVENPQKMPSLDDVDDVVNELIENESNSIPNPKTHVNVDAVENSQKMPSLDDVDDVVNESNSIPNPKTHVNVDAVENPQKNAEISTETKYDLNDHIILGDPDEIDFVKLLGDSHFDEDGEDSMSLCASLCGTPLRGNLDGFDIPGDASFKHVYSSTPLPTTDSYGASSMNTSKQCLKSSTATGESFTIATTTSRDQVQPNNPDPDQSTQMQAQNDKQTPFNISKVSQQPQVIKSFCRPSLSTLIDPKFEDNVKFDGRSFQTPIKYSAGSNKEFEKQVIQLFGDNLCYENVDSCKHSHYLYGPEVMKSRLKDLDKKGLDIAYKYIKQRPKLFNAYFPIFCELFGEKQFRTKLVELTSDCQEQSGCAKYLKNVVDGLMKTDLTRQKAIRMAMQKIVKSSDPINVFVDLILENDSDILEFMPKIEEFAGILKHQFTHNQIIRMAQISNATQNLQLIKVVFFIINNQSDIVSHQYIINFLKMIESLGQTEQATTTNS